jgi:hypothetical protein
MHAAVLLLASLCQSPEPQLKTRDALPTPPPAGPMAIVPAGTKMPIQLRQPVSTKNAVPGDPIYAQTAFPVVAGGVMLIPAGTWVQGVVDRVKRAGRIKGTAELEFHLTTLIYANGYTVDLKAALDQVPGAESSAVKEPGIVKQDAQKEKDVGHVITTASQTGMIGTMAGLATRSTTGVMTGGLAGIAAGTLIGILKRGDDVRFETGASLEISLSAPIAIEREKATKQ